MSSSLRRDAHIIEITGIDRGTERTDDRCVSRMRFVGGLDAPKESQIVRGVVHVPEEPWNRDGDVFE